MKNFLSSIALLSILVVAGCNSNTETRQADANKNFSSFEDRFLDAYWKKYPSNAIYVGYGKYYDMLEIPGEQLVKADMDFSKNWLDSLDRMGFKNLNDNDKISFNIIKNQLQADMWYTAEFKQYEWDASWYNLSSTCDYIINQPYAPLDKRLAILSKYLEHSPEYYQAGFKILHNPTKEHVELAIMQNKAGVVVFGETLTDSIKASHLTDVEKKVLQDRIAGTVTAMNIYVDSLDGLLKRKDYTFRSFRIGKALFTEKFKYDLAVTLSPEEVYSKAMDDKTKNQQRMVVIARQLWNKYYPGTVAPADSFLMVQKVLDKIQLKHAAPKDFYDSLTSQVHQLKRFIVEKKLFDFDTINPPVIVRYMPEYARGVTLASAEFTPPYQKVGNTYYNVDDLSAYPADKAEKALQEYNDYASQFLSIHEAMPGHCLQGIYNTRKSGDILRAVFQNGAMIEGWAVYAEEMMLENGWGGGSPEMELLFCKSRLRKIGNVLIDYDMQCLNKSKEDIMHMLIVDFFQTSAQAEEKYKRATLSQVQLCSYYSGGQAILALREAYKKKMGAQYSLKDFHEKFLSFGSSPVKYIAERMLH